MYEINESVIIAAPNGFNGCPGVIKRRINTELWSVYVTIPEEKQRRSEGSDYVLKQFTGAFHESELRRCEVRDELANLPKG